ncbi:MAG: NAD(P)H-dependent glycerol-3-phosphate dehydrogenase [Candidatus Omnitrophota bacterium]|nr:NAD(P)H-dependent glycerol-3-phosphate dehydrogenase [Candidatus Omnitrophota bacterium]
MKIAVLGDGGWGTALAVVSDRNKNDVVLWSAFPEYAKVLREKRENVKFLPGVELPEKIQIETNITSAIEFGEIVILAIPTQYLRNVLHKIKDLDYSKKIFVSVAKGIEKKTCLRPSEIILSVLGEKINLVVISGPSHAEEVARNMPTLIVAASSDRGVAAKVQQALLNPYFRIYVQTDIVGVELGGALKNVIAIAAGVCDGLKFGDNTKAGLLSRGLLEMARLGIRMGANPNTFFGLSGMGDLVTTCFSKHGRNLRVGRELGEGKKIKDILASMEMVAEGVDTAASVHELATRLGVDLPVMGEVYKLLFEDKDARSAVGDLLARDAHEEWKQY